MKPIIKWPGGKSGEIDKIVPLIPAHARYVEPFFGGGALFFHLAPRTAAINDISQALMRCYRLVKEQDRELKALLLCYSASFQHLAAVCGGEIEPVVQLYFRYRDGLLPREALHTALGEIVSGLSASIHAGFDEPIVLEWSEFDDILLRTAEDKLLRTAANDRKKPFSAADLRKNLLTGFMSGYYMYFRKIFNDLSLGRRAGQSEAYRAANFYFVREYCYGSMFRYNAAGEFNIPYGGMTYNKKDMRAKIEAMFARETAQRFAHTEVHCSDFETFFADIHLTNSDFIFLDPPYDTDFSDYEGRDFTKFDQERLAHALKKTEAGFILVIKNTEFIKSLYEKDFNVRSFDKQYACNVRSRNERKVEHLMITNLKTDRSV